MQEQKAHMVKLALKTSSQMIFRISLPASISSVSQHFIPYLSVQRNTTCNLFSCFKHLHFRQPPNILLTPSLETQALCLYSQSNDVGEMDGSMTALKHKGVCTVHFSRATYWNLFESLKTQCHWEKPSHLCYFFFFHLKVCHCCSKWHSNVDFLICMFTKHSCACLLYGLQ